ncbi:hypothetical protein HG536_0D05260 [Torulaspora globosa]|uniref:WW domain-containing protein n=1 Tax=Torulaspora globosa TaxID=48254 RepID=A0A7G3ZHL8_9SACH|nr:uncharacterized protein HG536_0D05260 [Torulaspora globosa]QLL33004.1 hypothetical protein HG536_0D05260 [Torulaspora globosa]
MTRAGRPLEEVREACLIGSRLLMGRVWNTFTAPDGRKYYYNSRTKQSSWQRPESFNDDESGCKGKRAKLVSEIEPFYVVPLVNDWNLVICDTGAKFYYNSTARKSTWTLTDTQSLQLLSSLSKDKLVVLIGVARGYDTERSEQIYKEVIHEVEALRETQLLDTTSGPGTGDEAGKEESDDQENTGGLVTAYSSSDEEEGAVEKEQGGDGEERQPAGAYNYDVDVFNNLETGGEPIEGLERNTVAQEALFSLFDRYSCDPYSAWSIQAKKIQDDPDFLKVSKDSLREEIFEEWCQQKVRNYAAGGAGQEVEPSEDDDEGTNAYDGLEPLKFHYLAHIVSKSTITPTTIFLDIKNEKKTDFKKYKIKQFVESKRLQEAFVSKLLFYYKRMTTEERKNVFREALDTQRHTIRENLHKNLQTVRKALDEAPPDPDDSYAVETRLLEMENWMGISGNVPNLADDPKYFVLGIKDKMNESMQYIKDII